MLLIGCAAIAWPKCNYDGLFYTAIASRAADAQGLHDAGMQFERRQPEDVKSPYRDDLAQNAEHFKEQLPFYTVKPLYVLLLSMIEATGLGWRSGALISGVCFYFLGWIVWWWLRQYYASPAATGLAGILMLNPALLQVVRWTSPDLMAILAVVAGTCVILQTGKVPQGILILVVGIWVRPEIIIYTGIVVCAVYLAHRLTLLGALGLGGVALGSYLIATRHGYPYSILFYHTFIERLVAPESAKVVISKSMYLTVLKHSVQTRAFENPILCLPFLASAVNYLVLRKRDLYSMLSIVALMSCFILFIVYPSFEARYYLSEMTFIPALVVLIQIKRSMDGLPHEEGEFAELRVAERKG